MSLKIYNTITRQKEEFKPLNENNVGMYVCGPTVYGMPHVGHAKSYISFDIIYRYLKFLGYKVKYVQNVTDVGHLLHDEDAGEDKIQEQARIEKTDPVAVAYKYETIYFDCMDKLNIERPSISCRATGHIIEIIEMIQKLIEKGYAYVTSLNNVYFNITKFKEYGKLSNRTIDSNISGERINIADDKERPEDFALWKSADESHIMRWQSPWGEGYPGWHIECSVMSKKYLGDTFDIHGGGMDNIFPHHDCEIAQSESANDKPFARYFIHNNLVAINGQKMGKSLGNFTTLPELFEEYDPMIIRFYIMLVHYRSVTDFDRERIEETGKNYEKIRTSFEKAEELISNKNIEITPDDEIHKIKDKFLEAMDDDFNTSVAISYIYELVKIINKEITLENIDYNKLANIVEFKEKYIEGILGLKFINNTENKKDKSDEYIKYILELRRKFRAEKRFDMSDKIRDDLADMGIEIKDTKDGVSY